MLTQNVINQLIVNVAVLIIIANLLSHIHAFQRAIIQDHRSVKQDFVLSLVFVAVIMLCSLMEVDMGEYSINTRIVAVMSAGLLGGPLTGLFTSLLGGAYVLFTTVPASMARVEAFALVCCGLLGSGFYPYFQRGKWKYLDLIMLGVFAELFEIFSLFRLTLSTSIAIDAIMNSSLPMILVNSTGLVIFIANFNYVFIQQDAETSRQLEKLGLVTREGMRLFSQGLYNRENLDKFVDTLMEHFEFSGVMITDRDHILHCHHPNINLNMGDLEALPKIAIDAMQAGTLMTMETPPEGSVWESALQDNFSAAVPFMVLGQPKGCLIVWVKRRWYAQRIELQFMEIVQNLISYQLSINELNIQKELTSQAELKALQFQVNPHFLFNALNTISFVCREDSERAVKLLRILASYFRYSLKRIGFMEPFDDVIGHVQDYLAIEQARFEDKLDVVFDIPESVDIDVPVLVLQPIIENAVRYGMSSDGIRHVEIRAEKFDGGLHVDVSDRGAGMPEDILSSLLQDTDIPNHIGLTNVNRRLQSIYGAEHGLHIKSSLGEGTCVSMDFYKEEHADE